MLKAIMDMFKKRQQMGYRSTLNTPGALPGTMAHYIPGTRGSRDHAASVRRTKKRQRRRAYFKMRRTRA